MGTEDRGCMDRLSADMWSSALDGSVSPPTERLSRLEVKLDAELAARAAVLDAIPGGARTDDQDTDAPESLDVVVPAVALPTDSAARKRVPLCSGLLDYFGAALILIAGACEDELPSKDDTDDDLADQILSSLHLRDERGAPQWREYRKLCLSALALLHGEITGELPPIAYAGSLAGLFGAYPAALAAVAEVSWYGNNKHNPGQPLHHARAKSTDQEDCIVRHLVDNMQDPGGYDGEMRHAACLVWRCLALTQIALERSGAPKARGAR